MKGWELRKMKKYIKLYIKFLSQSVQELLSYRMTAVLVSVFGLLFFATELILGAVYFSYTDTLLSWTRKEYLLLVSSATTMNYLYQFLFISSHENLSSVIVEGELDYTLLRPVNSFLFYNFYRFDFPSMLNAVLSVGFQLYLLRDIRAGMGTILLYIGLLLLGTWFLFLMNFIVISLSFWSEKSDKLLSIPEYLMDFSARPRDIYPGAVRFVLSFVVPILLCVNSPALLIRGELHLSHVLVLIFFDLMFTGVAVLLWNKGIEKYVSSN